MDDGEDSGWNRSEWARWFLDHDDVDEAARVLEPGDVVQLGEFEIADLQAALTRRGLEGRLEGRELFVSAPVGSGERDAARRPPLRASAPMPVASKRWA